MRDYAEGERKKEAFPVFYKLLLKSQDYFRDDLRRTELELKNNSSTLVASGVVFCAALRAEFRGEVFGRTVPL